MELAIHNAFVIECHERKGTNGPGRVSLDFRYDLAEGLIGNSRTQAKASNAPRNEEFRLQNVGAHMPEILPNGEIVLFAAKVLGNPMAVNLKMFPRIGHPWFHKCPAEHILQGV